MEPVTHFLTGACLGRSGFNRKTAYATLAMTLAAEAPDIDVLWSFRGPVAGFEHHRGFTHTFLGAPLVALAVTAIVWLWHRSRKHQPALAPRWALLWLLSLLGGLSHIFLDWTNNYGVRPFSPFNPRWYALDIAFILEPVVFAALLLGLIVPAILGLADREMGARKPLFRGRGWAIAALFLVGFLPEIVIACELKNKEFTVINWHGARMSIATHIVWHKDKWISPGMQGFLDVLKEMLRAPTSSAALLQHRAV